MDLISFADANAYYRRAEAFLTAHEAEHNLILGICSALTAHPERFENPYLALVEDKATVVAAALMTPPRNLVLSLADQPAAVDHFAAHLAETGRSVPAVAGPPEVAARFAGTWKRITGRSYHPHLALRIYRLEKVRPPQAVSGRLRAATPRDRDMLVDWALEFNAEALGERDPAAAAGAVDRLLTSDNSGLALWEDGLPVSMAGYTGPTPHGIRINLVYTPPALRQRGYASACVAALSQQMLDGGRRFCFLFTDLKNPTSNAIYQAIGYEPVSDVSELTFGSE